ncbi:MAG TPA: hypothetical protein VF585_07865 [Chthoniobacterales bacterium]|jgi:chorismate-pyruvate lyase
MTAAKTPMQDVSRRLLSHERSETGTSAAFSVFDKLRPRLATFLGKAGVAALLSRSIALAGKELPWLRAVLVLPDGSMQAPDDMPRKSADALLGEVLLLAHLLNLLVTFIGANLTMQMIHEIWPSLSLDGPIKGEPK